MPLRYLLDTNTLSDLIRNPQGLVAQRISLARESTVCTSIIVAAERRAAEESLKALGMERHQALIVSHREPREAIPAAREGPAAGCRQIAAV